MYKVLIVDDQEVLRFDLKRMKVWGDISGFAIEGEAANGMEAIKLLKASAYDLVITDIRMPVVDGLELLRTTAKEKLCSCVVLLSDYTEFAYAREGLVHGAFDYLGKPVDSSKMLELLNRARQYLEERKQEDEKLRHLEGLAGEAFFPYTDIEKAALLINQAKDEALEVMEQMTDTIGAALDHDLPKSIIILTNAINEICSKVFAEHGWIELYTESSIFRNLHLKDASDWPAVHRKVRKLTEALLSFLHKFIIWNNCNDTIKSACLHALYHIEDGISVKNTAEKLYMSKSYLSELFRQSTGISLLEYITALKVERAKYLLATSPFRNYEIAEKLGFNDHEYFSKIFKKHTGTSPAIFKKSNNMVFFG